MLTPKVSLQGEPKLAKKTATFDYVFGPDDSNEAVFDAIGAPLVGRAKEGMVGVVFAYGQTGSGKTHTMNGLMVRHPELKLKIPAQVFCMSWCADFESRGT